MIAGSSLSPKGQFRRGRRLLV